MRPRLKFLEVSLIERILLEARELLVELGVEIHNDGLVELLAGNGARVESDRVHFTQDLIDTALKNACPGFKLYDALGEQTHDLSGDKVHFTPGSAAINILDHGLGAMRKPVTADYVDFVKLVSRLDNIAAQSTAFIPADVAEGVSDSYRLFLSLLYGEKPVVTGVFAAESFRVMHDMLIAVRGSAEALREKPLAIFTCCPTIPLKWGATASQNLVDCALAGIPVEYVAMPMSGFITPVTIVGSLVQHTAETLGGIVITQLTRPGAPALYGGSPAAFDVRYETTPMGAIESQMIDCAYSEIAKYLGIPSQAYISLSDSKLLDAQAGFETAMGATLAGLTGINSISGPGMLDFENCQSLEKLVLDNEIAGLVLRLTRGVEPRDDFPALPIFKELLEEGHLLIAGHTRKHLRAEHCFPGPVVDRASGSRWRAEGSLTLGERAHSEVEKHIEAYEPSRLPGESKSELVRLMESEAARHGARALPGRPA